MKRTKFTVVKNAFANLVRGGATAIVALALPHFLTRMLNQDRFSAWSLMLQVAAYANYLDFGLQTSLARFVAQATERGEHGHRNRLISTALGLLILAMLVAFSIIGVVIWQLPRIVPSLPASLLREFRIAVFILAGSAAVLLPLSTFSGVLIGLHKNEYTALAIGGSRIVGAIAVLLMARHTQSLILLASCLGVASLLGGFAQIYFAKFLIPSLRIAWSLMSSAVAKELSKFSAGLMAWSLSGLLVAGMDLTILGYFNFREVGYYAIATTLVTFIVGMNGAVGSALMTPLAALHAASAVERVRNITMKVTRLVTYFNLLLTCVIFLAGHLLLRVWVGNSYALKADLVLEILMVATTIRLVASPYGSMLIATGQQKHGIAQGVVEGLTNLASSIALGYWFGAVGVAMGTLVGAIFGLMWTCIFTLDWAKELPLPRSEFLTEGLIRPIAVTSPLLLFTAVWYKHPATPLSLGILAACGALTCLLTARLGRMLPARLPWSHILRANAQ